MRVRTYASERGITGVNLEDRSRRLSRMTIVWDIVRSCFAEGGPFGRENRKMNSLDETHLPESRLSEQVNMCLVAYLIHMLQSHLYRTTIVQAEVQAKYRQQSTLSRPSKIGSSIFSLQTSIVVAVLMAPCRSLLVKRLFLREQRQECPTATAFRRHFRIGRKTSKQQKHESVHQTI
jgi:hypothetical protein